MFHCTLGWLKCLGFSCCLLIIRELAGCTILGCLGSMHLNLLIDFHFLLVWYLVMKDVNELCLSELGLAEG